jgi:hypothetical protein
MKLGKSVDLNNTQDVAITINHFEKRKAKDYKEIN